MFAKATAASEMPPCSSINEHLSSKSLTGAGEVMISEEREVDLNGW